MATVAFSAGQAGDPVGALRIGELLVRNGHVSAERVEEALAQQAGSGKRLGNRGGDEVRPALDRQNGSIFWW